MHHRGIAELQRIIGLWSEADTAWTTCTTSISTGIYGAVGTASQLSSGHGERASIQPSNVDQCRLPALEQLAHFGADGARRRALLHSCRCRRGRRRLSRTRPALAHLALTPAPFVLLVDLGHDVAEGQEQDLGLRQSRVKVDLPSAQMPSSQAPSDSPFPSSRWRTSTPRRTRSSTG